MILAIVLAMTGAVEPIAARKGILHLADAIESSTFICIGTEIEARTVQVPRNETKGDVWADFTPTEAPVGVIRVERVLKGDPQVTVVHHETWSSWTCDDTRGSIGRRGIYFLGPGVVSRRPAAQRESILAQLGARAILRNVGSGDGIVTIADDADGEWVRFFGAPDALRPRVDPKIPPLIKRPGDERRIPVAAFLGYIEDLCRFDPAALAIHARAFEPTRSGEHPYDLRILPNGDARLAIGSQFDEVVRMFTLEPAAWNDLSMELVRLAQDRYVDAGESAEQPRRSLRVSIANRSIRFLDPGNLDFGLMSPARRDLFRTAVKAWTLVRAAIDCPECADHRNADEEWLK